MLIVYFRIQDKKSVLTYNSVERICTYKLIFKTTESHNIQRSVTYSVNKHSRSKVFIGLYKSIANYAK